jgi:DNA polymerase-1
MVRVYSEFKNRNLKSKIILQVHDELVIDVYSDEVEIVKEILQTQMENVINLDVKLTINIACGNTWYEAK